MPSMLRVLMSMSPSARLAFSPTTIGWRMSHARGRPRSAGRRDQPSRRGMPRVAGSRPTFLRHFCGGFPVFAAVGGALGGAGEVALADHVAEQRVARASSRAASVAASARRGRWAERPAVRLPASRVVQQHDGHLDQGEAVRARRWVTVGGHGLQGMHRATSVVTAGSLLAAKGRAMRSGSTPSWPAARAARVGASR